MRVLGRRYTAAKTSYATDGHGDDRLVDRQKGIFDLLVYLFKEISFRENLG